MRRGLDSAGWYSECCYECGVWWKITADHQEQLLKSKRLFYCPNGHSQHYTENKEDRLRRDVQRLEQRNAMLAEETENARKLAKNAITNLKRTKTVLKNTKRRAHAGVCLECHRTFTNVALHMKTKHPHVTHEEVPLEEGLPT